MTGAGMVAFAAPEGGLMAREIIGAELMNVRAPKLSLPNKMFLLHIELPPEDDDIPAINSEPAKRIVGACLVHVTGGPLDHLRVHAPSQVEAGEPFGILVRPEDAHRNVACERAGELAVRLNGAAVGYTERVDDGESACCRLEGLRLAEPGVARLVVQDAAGRTATSNPIRVVEGLDGETKHYWGMIHGHTEFSDGAGTIEHYLTYMREQCGLDFGAPGDHDHVFETSDDMWRQTQEAVARHNEPGEFVTLLGYEWAKWRQNGDGDRNVYYLEEHRPMHRSDEGHYPTPPDLYRALEEEKAIIIPHHSANRGNHCDWKDYDPKKDRLVEIFSEWGCSERSLNDGNVYRMRPWRDEPDRPDSGEVPEGFVERALALGWRVGFTAGGDDHTSHPGDLTLRGGTPPRTPGLLALRAREKTREAIWQALYDRNCYGTTGARIIVDFRVNGAPMGSELWLEEMPELYDARWLNIEVHGTDVIEKIEVVRNNEALLTYEGTACDEVISVEDVAAFEVVALDPGPHWPTPFLFYYLRITQADGEMAWVSPVWIS